MVRNVYRGVGTGIAIWCLAAPVMAAVQTYGNFHTLGVVLRPPPPLTADTVGAIRLYEVRPGGDRLLQAPVRVATFDYFAGSVFGLTPATTYHFRADYHDTGGALADSEAFVGLTRTEPVGPPPAEYEIYVAPNGSDSAPGTLSQPKRTLAAAFTAVVEPGTHVILREGIYYEGNLNPPGDGTPTAPTVIRAYPGEYPAIDGSDPAMVQAGWTVLGGGYFRRNFTANTWLVAFRNRTTGQTTRCYPMRTLAELNERYAGEPANTFARFNITGAYYCSGTQITVYCPSFSGTAGDIELRVSIRGGGIEHSPDDHLVYDGLTLRYFQSHGIYVNDSDDVHIRNCRFEFINTPVSVKRGSDRLLIEDNTFIDDCVRWGMLPKTTEGFDYAGYIETGAVMVHWPYDGRGLVIRRNTIDGLFDGMHLVPTGLSPVPDTSETDFYQNTIRSACDDLIELDGFSRNVRVFGNSMSNHLSGVSIAAAVHGPTYILHNDLVRHGNSTATSISGLQGYPIKSNGGVESGLTGWVYLYHNTAWTDVPDTPGFRVQYANWQGLTMANNIWQGTERAWWNWQPFLDPVHIGRDLIYSTSGPFLRINGLGNFTTNTLTDAPADFHVMTNAIHAPAGLANPAQGDFSLAPGSIAIDRGVLLPGINDLTYSGAAPDLGSHEVGASVLVDFRPAASSVTEAAPSATLGVFLSRESLAPVSIQYAVTGGTASNGLDYTLAAGSLVFPPTETNRVLVIPIHPDALEEANETILITLFAPTNALLGTAHIHTLTVLDDDAPPPVVRFVLPDSSAPEAAGTAMPLVALDHAYGLPVSVMVLHTGGTAVPGSDFTLGTSLLSFPPGTLQQTVLVAIVDDTLPELPETVNLALRSPTEATLGTVSNHTLTLIDNDPVAIAFSSAEAKVDEGLPQVPLAVLLSGPADFSLSVDLVVAGGTALHGIDYHLTPRTLVFGPGQVATNLLLTLVDDTDAEMPETLVLQLLAPTNAILGDAAVFTCTIRDNDYPVIRVAPQAAGLGNGSSWADAYTNLAMALTAAPAFAQFWVAQGVYTPGSTVTDSFRPPSDSILYGGFAGTESTLDQRNPALRPTVLSGDLARDDGPAWSQRADNAQHVITCVNSNVTLDGFIVRGGNASTGSVFLAVSQGGGLWANLVRDLIIRRCVFTDNSAAAGGGLYLRRCGGVRVEDCVFSGNRATENGSDRGSGAAGGEAVTVDDDARFWRCHFTGNTAPSGRGGAIYATTTPWALDLDNCLFAGNGAGDVGGGIFLRGYNSEMRGCTFSGNAPSAIYIRDATPLVRGSILWANADEVAIFSGALSVSHTDIDEAGYDGGGNLRVDPQWRGAPSGTWVSNAVYDAVLGFTTLYAAANWPPGEHAGRVVNPDTRQALQFLVRGHTATTLEIWGDATGLASAGAPYRIFDYTLAASSPCLDTVPVDQAPADDLRAVLRPQGLAADMGAYELATFRVDLEGSPRMGFPPLLTTFTTITHGATTNSFYYRWDFDGDGTPELEGPALAIVSNVYSAPGRFSVGLVVSNAADEVAQAFKADYVTLSPTTLYVSLDGAHVWPYADWASAATNMADALQTAVDGALVLVSNGTYRLPAQLDLTRALTLRSLAGAADTILDGRGSARCVFLSHTNARVEGFTLRGGFADNGGGAYISFGGELRHCIIRDNEALVSGGGVYAYQGGRVSDSFIYSNRCANSGGGAALYLTGRVESCVISSNRAGVSGGGVLCDQGGSVELSTLADNAADDDGGGICALGAVEIADCHVTRNTCGDDGGGAYLTGAATMRRSTITDNTSGDDAAGVQCGDAGGIQGGHLDACSLVGNVANDKGGAGYLWTGGSVVNCVAVSNRAPEGGAFYCRDGGTFQNCTVAGNTATVFGGGLIYRNGGISRNTIYAHNTAPANADIGTAGGSHTFHHVCAPVTLDGEGNRMQEPGLVNVQDGDLRLAAGSPCIDAGTATQAPDTDLLGHMRPLDGDWNGTPAFDIGAHEFVHPLHDSDEDGLPDLWESRYGLNPARAVAEDGADGDPDGDGATNRAEYEADTDPSDVSSVLAFVTIGGDASAHALHWKGGTAAMQIVEWNSGTSGLEAPWLALHTNAPPTALATNLMHATTNAVGYYRLRAHRP